MTNENNRGSYLRRLDSSSYCGTAFIHWTFTITDRKQGWLDKSFHELFRERLIHCCFRYRLWCPAYCLMPDHMHILFLGERQSSDQLKAVKWLRKQINWLLNPRGFKLQQQGYDHVLREKERDRFAFEKLVFYVRDNPARAGLIESAKDWHSTGAVLPGFPEISPDLGDELFWEKFWKLYYQSVERAE